MKITKAQLLKQYEELAKECAVRGDVIADMQRAAKTSELVREFSARLIETENKIYGLDECIRNLTAENRALAIRNQNLSNLFNLACKEEVEAQEKKEEPAELPSHLM